MAMAFDGISIMYPNFKYRHDLPVGHLNTTRHCPVDATGWAWTSNNASNNFWKHRK